MVILETRFGPGYVIHRSNRKELRTEKSRIFEDLIKVKDALLCRELIFWIFTFIACCLKFYIEHQSVFWLLFLKCLMVFYRELRVWKQFLFLLVYYATKLWIIFLKGSFQLHYIFRIWAAWKVKLKNPLQSCGRLWYYRNFGALVRSRIPHAQEL